MISQRSLASFIFLNIITLGIYGIFWGFYFVNDVNKVCEGDGRQSLNFILVCLLSMVTCGIYGLVWMYDQQDRLKAAGLKYNIMIMETGKEVILWEIFGSLIIVGPFIALNIMIKSINVLANIYNQQFYTTNFASVSNPNPNSVSTFTSASNSPVIDSAEIQEKNLESDIQEEDMTDNVIIAETTIIVDDEELETKAEDVVDDVIITETIVTVEDEEVDTSVEEDNAVIDETEEKVEKKDGNNIV